MTALPSTAYNPHPEFPFDLEILANSFWKLVAQLVCGFKIEVRLAVTGSGKSRTLPIPFSSSTLRMPVRSTGQNPSTGDGDSGYHAVSVPGHPGPSSPLLF